MRRRKPEGTERHFKKGTQTCLKYFNIQNAITIGRVKIFLCFSFLNGAASIYFHVVSLPWTKQMAVQRKYIINAIHGGRYLLALSSPYVEQSGHSTTNIYLQIILHESIHAMIQCGVLLDRHKQQKCFLFQISIAKINKLNFNC